MSSLLSAPEMQEQFEELVKGLGEDGAPADAAGQGSDSMKAGSSAEAKVAAEESFQETIRKTMERMQTSDSTAKASAADAGSDDFLAQMLKEMEGGGFGAEGSDEDFSKILMGMMEQLTNKEILYEPMKELADKFPDWLEKNSKETKEDDLKRYEEQAFLVKEIVARFERTGYSDNNTEDREYIVERMQKVGARCHMKPPFTDWVIDASCRVTTSGSCRRYDGCTGSTGGLGRWLSHAVTR